MPISSICRGTSCTGGRGGIILELDWDGRVVWEYVNPFFGENERFGRVNLVFRAYRYGPDFPGFRGKAFDPEKHAWFSHLYHRR